MQENLKNKLIKFIEKIYYDESTIKKIDFYMKEIDDIVKPKKENLSYQDITDLRDIFFEIKNDELLYSSAIYKYKTKMKTLDCLFYEEINIMNICDTIDKDDSIQEYVVELNYDIDVDELIYLNYLYNLIINSFLKDKKVNIILIKKIKNKVKIK